MTDAQEHAEPVEPEHAPLTGEERASQERMLMVQYGIPWILSALELDIACMTEDDQQQVAMEPNLIFSLTIPDNVYPLPNVAETVCAVSTWDLGRSEYLVSWILGLSARC